MKKDATRSLETAASGWTLKTTTRIGVIRAPPPMPVSPTTKPTSSPATARDRSMCMTYDPPSRRRDGLERRPAPDRAAAFDAFWRIVWAGKDRVKRSVSWRQGHCDGLEPPTPLVIMTRLTVSAQAGGGRVGSVRGSAALGA